MRQVRPDGWRGIQPREMVIKRALYGILKDAREGGARLSHHQGPVGVLMITQVQLGDLAVDVVLKDIKHVHLGVDPPPAESASRRLAG